MKCRICNKEIDNYVFSLGNQPVSNEYIEGSCGNEKTYPLDLFFCEDCTLLQIDEVVPADEIFSTDYPYVSSCSSTWFDHCKAYTDYVIDRFNIGKDRLIMEIASNDGCLLRNFVDRGYTVKGVEPSSGVADIALANGVDTDKEFCNPDYMRRYIELNKKPHLIIANNVIAHNPKVVEFVGSVSALLGEGGIFTIEFPHLYNLIKLKQFDTIYHEHYSYFTLCSMRLLLEKCGLTIFDVQELPTHGGSLRVFAKHKYDDAHAVDYKALSSITDKERDFGLYHTEVYKRFSEDIKDIGTKTMDFLEKQKSIGKRVVGYGAPAKGNTFLNYCGIGNELIEYTVDRSEYKVGKKLPGSHIPICSVDKIMDDNPDYIFILPWNIKKEIVNLLGKDKTKYITAIPELEIT